MGVWYTCTTNGIISSKSIVSRRDADNKSSDSCINDIEWFIAHYEENQKGFTVAGFIPLQESFKVKKTVEGEINYSYMKYSNKCSPHLRNRVTKPYVRVDEKGIYFDFFVNFTIQ